MKDWKYNGAFVLQFKLETNFEAGRCQGWVEHITSYKATRFNSLEELTAFVGQVLLEIRDGQERGDGVSDSD